MRNSTTSSCGFSPWYMASTHGLDPRSVVEAVVDGVAEGCERFGLRAKLIGILCRSFGPMLARWNSRRLLAFHEHLVAIDLAGDEMKLSLPRYSRPISEEFETSAAGDGARRGRRAGPESVWDAIKRLGAQRIGHGTRASRIFR